ncbi:MAG: hypothetical protein ABI963_08030 [Rhizomicrobium sp.]
MQKSSRALSEPKIEADSAKSAASALALACEWLQVGNMAEAAKWAAIAASLCEAEAALPQTA